LKHLHEQIDRKSPVKENKTAGASCQQLLFLSIVYSLVYSELHKKLKKEVRFDNIDGKRKTLRTSGRYM
jgi:hypothetical protein